MYKFEINRQKKYLLVTAAGTFSVDDGIGFINELSENLKKINATEYALIVDASEQRVLSPDIIPYLEKVMKTYIDTPFRKRIHIKPASTIAESQIKRVGKDPLAENFEAFNSLEEALKNV